MRCSHSCKKLHTVRLRVTSAVPSTTPYKMYSGVQLLLVGRCTSHASKPISCLISWKAPGENKSGIHDAVVPGRGDGYKIKEVVQRQYGNTCRLIKIAASEASPAGTKERTTPDMQSLCWNQPIKPSMVAKITFAVDLKPPHDPQLPHDANPESPGVHGGSGTGYQGVPLFRGTSGFQGFDAQHTENN